MKRILFLILIIAVFTPNILAKSYDLLSPDKRVKLILNVEDVITYTLHKDGEILIAPTRIDIIIDNRVLGENASVKSVKRSSSSVEFETPIYKKSLVKDTYNQMIILFKNSFSIIVRTYNDGMAYRFKIDSDKPFKVTDEINNLTFPYDVTMYASYSNRHPEESFELQFNTSFENIHDIKPVTQLNKKNLVFLPVLASYESGKKLVFTESDQIDYPGMFLNNGGAGYSMRAVFAPRVKDQELGGHNNLQMMAKSFHDYIAYAEEGREFPWRTAIISNEDKELLENDMVYRLATPSAIGDVSWIKPGKVAWDWWNAWNIEGVDFESGINTMTYKFYIDFASEYGIEYVILDEGWAVNKMCDLFKVVPEIDLEEIVSYAEKRDVGIILWAGYWAYRKDMEIVTKHYADMGVKGFKIDFMDRDDQDVIEFLYDAAEVCAKYKMLIDYHGVSKPSGLHRTYPNVLNFEGVMGLEQLKWKPKGYDQVVYDVEIPFIRMVAGPMDYTQGAMRNAIMRNYYPSYTEPMSQGTRCRQLAQYVIFDSPLNMLCDSPTNYMKEYESSTFIASVPTIWDETMALDSKLGEYVVLGRRAGDIWYVGGMTNWDEREMDIDLSFLKQGKYRIELFIDGINANKKASDYKKEFIDFDRDKEIFMRISMAKGGGFAAIIREL